MTTTGSLEWSRVASRLIRSSAGVQPFLQRMLQDPMRIVRAAVCSGPYVAPFSALPGMNAPLNDGLLGVRDPGEPGRRKSPMLGISLQRLRPFAACRYTSDQTSPPLEAPRCPQQRSHRHRRSRDGPYPQRSKILTQSTNLLPKMSQQRTRRTSSGRIRRSRTGPEDKPS